MKSLVMAAGLLARLSLAAADDASETPAAAPPEASPFVTMFHQDGATKVDIDAAYVFFNHDNPNNPTKLYRGDLFTQFVDPSNGLGGYATVPGIHSTDPMTTTDSVGGLEIGGVFVRKLDTATMVVHAGFVFPTVSSDPSGLFELAGSVVRLPELYATIPDAISLRIGISPLFHAGRLFVRLDVNVDANVSTRTQTQSPGFELDAGMGYSIGLVAMMAELTNMILTGDNSVTYDVGAISARLDLGKVKPYVAVSFPLDDGASQIMRAGVTVGLTATP